MFKKSLVSFLVVCSLVASISTRDSSRSFGRSISKRDAIDDAYNAFEDKMTKLSRLVTGVSLQTGLADESIPIDKVLGELLGLGNVGVDTLEAAVQNGLKDFAEKVKAAFTKLSAQAKTTWTNIYNFHTVKENVKKKWNSAGLSSLPAATELSKLDPLKTLDYSGIVSLDLPKSIGILKKGSTSEYGALKTALTGFGTAATTLRTTTWQKYFDVLDKMAPLAWLVENDENFKKLSPVGLLNNQAKQIDDAKAVISSVSAIASIGSLDLTSLESFSTRTIHRDRQHTAGFVRGIQDIKDLSAVAQDPWIAASTNSTVDSETLKLLEQLHGKLLDVDNSWKPTVSMLTVLQKAEQFRISLSTSQLPEDRLKPVVEKLTGCFDSSQFPADVTKSGLSIYNILSKMSSLRRIVVHLTDAEKKKFDALGNANNANGIAELRELLRNMTEDVKILKEAPDLKTSVDELNANYGTLDLTAFSSGVGVKNAIAMFDCFNTMTENTNDVANYYRGVIAVLDDLKASSLLSTIQEISNQISGASQNLQALRNVQDALKKDKSPGMAQMMKLKALQKFSKPLGESVSALVAIKSTLEHKTDFELFKSEGSKIDAEIAKVPVATTLKSLWGDFHESAQAVQVLLDSAAAKKQSLPAAAGSTPADYGPLFESLTGIASPDLKIDKKLQALDALLPAPNADVTTIKKVQQALKKMAEVNLQFASFDASLGGMTGTLKQVVGTIQNPSVANSSNSSKTDGSEDEDDEDAADEEEEGPSSPLIAIISLSIVGLVEVILTIYVIKLLWKMWKKRQHDKQKQSEKTKTKKKKKGKGSDASTTKTESTAESAMSSVQKD